MSLDVEKEINEVRGFNNLELLANQVVEGFISGLHKSPFHGFSAEFAEHKIYNQGESTKHIDWKLFAKTDKLYTKRYEEETNLRCHLIIDNSSSMHFPKINSFSLNTFNKIGFSVLATAAIMNLMKRQRDAVGMSIYGEDYEFYAAEKGSERHHRMLLNELNSLLRQQPLQTGTSSVEHLHLIAEKLKRRSLVFLFSDMFQTSIEQEEIFEALQHLKYKKHEVILFHTFDKKLELQLDFENKPTRFFDVETGEYIDLYAEHVKENYTKAVGDFFKELELRCGQYRIKYVPSDINENFNKILLTYLLERQRFG